MGIDFWWEYRKCSLCWHVWNGSVSHQYGEPFVVAYLLRMWARYMQLIIGTGGDLLWKQEWNTEFHKGWRITWLFKHLLSQEGLCCMELVIEICKFYIFNIPSITRLTCTSQIILCLSSCIALIYFVKKCEYLDFIAFVAT